MQHDKRELAYFQEQSLDYKIAMSNERIKAWYESWCRFDIYDEKTGKSRFVTMDTRDNSVPNMSDSEYITGIKDGQGRGWKNWGKCPWITYEANVTKPVTVTEPKTTSTSSSKTPTYNVGTVLTLQVNLKVRTGAGTNYSQKKRSQLTTDGQKHAQAGTYAVLLKGTRVTLLETKKVGNDIWGRCPSGWIALYYQGSIYAK